VFLDGKTMIINTKGELIHKSKYLYRLCNYGPLENRYYTIGEDEKINRYILADLLTGKVIKGRRIYAR
jgi:hypothetical protein